MYLICNDNFFKDSTFYPKMYIAKYWKTDTSCINITTNKKVSCGNNSSQINPPKALPRAMVYNMRYNTMEHSFL